MTHIYNLEEELIDITDTLVFEEESLFFNETYATDFVETVLNMIDHFIIDNPSIISEPDFRDVLLEEITDLFLIQMEDHLYMNDIIEHDINDIIEYAFNIYITTFYPELSSLTITDNNDESNNDESNNDESCIANKTNIDMIEYKIQLLRDIPQPVQRTNEWYSFRWNLITASNAWKAFKTQSTINQLIYEKCQPLKTIDLDTFNEEIKMVNVNTTLHWGQKYEPLSVMMYEHMYDSKVEEFGCIAHSKYKFIGASPDGIIIKSNTGRFGRMLEIKNIVNRIINGIPKYEYWVQMQLQMEVCDLNECDFLETKFTEYIDYEHYQNDVFVGDDTSVNDDTILTKTKEGNFKGTIIYFHTKDGSPKYEYMPLNIISLKDVGLWEENTISKYCSEPYNYIFMKFIYWKLEQLSCVLVLRDEEWFKNNVGQLENIWNIIEKERISGYQHRAPKKNTKKNSQTTENENDNTSCFLKVIKID